MAHKRARWQVRKRELQEGMRLSEEEIEVMMMNFPGHPGEVQPDHLDAARLMYSDEQVQLHDRHCCAQPDREVTECGHLVFEYDALGLRERLEETPPQEGGALV